MNVLVKLGLMTKKRQAELIEIDRHLANDQQRKHDLERLKNIAGRYSIEELDVAIQRPEKAA